MRKALLLLFLAGASLASTGVHTTYLWHMHQPIYWPDESVWTPGRYQTAYETLLGGYCQNDLAEIFGKDDRIGDYQWYPRDAVASMLDLPEAGAQVSFAGALVENIESLAEAGWDGGVYASDWTSHYREARGWTTSAGEPRLEPLVVGFHHAIAPLMDDVAFRMELACAKAIYDEAWGDSNFSRGFFPAEMCFSERLIPALVDAGLDWSVVGDLHIARACENYPYQANLDNCDPPNRADQVNPPQSDWTNHSIPRGVTLKVPYPYGFTPHRAEYVDPSTGEVSNLVVVPAANAMSWDEGYGMFGTGSIDAIAGSNDPAHPMLILLAHDGDNAWSGGHSYYYESVPNFSHAAADAGYTPSTVATYLEHHPVPLDDVVHVEDGGWVNADGDFGSPQFINWNWPPVDAAGNFDIPGGWAEDERNWAVLTAAQNVVESAEAVGGAPDPERVVFPLSGASAVERAWHFLLAGYESGYMYYGSSLDMEVKATLACNAALEAALPLAESGADIVAPSIWLPQRLPWNPGGKGGGSLWGYPGGAGADMSRDFFVWTFIHDISGLSRVEIMVREDLDGHNDPGSHDNEIYAGGPEVGAWSALPMNHRAMPLGEPWDIPGIDFTVLPERIADEYWIELTGYGDVLLDYYVEAEDSLGNVKRSPIQHVYVGTGDAGGDGSAWWEPELPEAGDWITVYYDPAGGPLDGAAEIILHHGINGWQEVGDTPMDWNLVDEHWHKGIQLPEHASSFEFVFHDGLGNWDNNGGADWIVPVSGGGGGFVMDGLLDEGVLQISGDGMNLWVAREGDQLYLATEGTGATGLDHFLFLLDEPGAPVSAPWAKAGQVLPWAYYLGAESSNGWFAWFDAGSNVQIGPEFSSAQGEVLEGLLDLDSLFASVPPESLWVAAAGYDDPDAGSLIAQAPFGDGDGDMEAHEYYLLLDLSTRVDESPEAPLAVSLYPNPFNPDVRLSLDSPDGDLTIRIYDLEGRYVATLHEGLAAEGRHILGWNGQNARGYPCPSGIYLFQISCGTEARSLKGLLLK